MSRGPGAVIGPPRAVRRSHHGSRPMFSQGPMINPARTSSERSSPNASTTASSPPRFASGYATSPASAEPSTTGAVSSYPAVWGAAYTEQLDT